jgi:4-hydroxythreonine-4-phosphate dehydrogenase
MRPKILMLMGDTAGVGPELCAKVAEDLPDAAEGVQIILTGDKRVFKEAQKFIGSDNFYPGISSFEESEDKDAPLLFWDYRTADIDNIPRAAVSAEAGKEVLAGLENAISLAKKGAIDGIVFAPFNKESMHNAGAKHSSELELFKEEFGCPDITGEFNILDGLWLARVTSHVPISEIAKNLSIDRIGHTIQLLGETLEHAGLVPSFAVAALNPHAGEHGLFGDEEARLITPAIEKMKKEHPAWSLAGPMPADTLFPRALKEGYSGVIGMYHDQLQIASKILGLERGVTFHPGMKVPIATAAHGTAFDIQGTGKVNHQALKNALSVVCEMAVKQERK